MLGWQIVNIHGFVEEIRVEETASFVQKQRFENISKKENEELYIYIYMIHSLLFISSWLASEPEIETLEDKKRTYKTGFEMTT